MDIDNATELQAEAGPVQGMQEQPGGRIAIENGKPRGVASLDEVNRSAFAALFEHHAWSGPLLEAAIVVGVTSGERGIRCVSPYGDDYTGNHADPEKHAAYMAHVFGEVAKHQPWLVPMLAAANAGVVIYPGCFCFTVPTRPGAQWDLPSLTPLTLLAPFADDGEVAIH